MLPAPLPALPLEDLLGRPRWWLGFSGGLDSTVAAALYVADGHHRSAAGSRVAGDSITTSYCSRSRS